MRPGNRKALYKSTPRGGILDQLEQTKASICAKVEHPFRMIKQRFRHAKVRYRVLANITAQQHTLIALSNLWMVRRTLLQETMRGRVRLPAARGS
jgi:transposase, IS5 family